MRSAINRFLVVVGIALVLTGQGDAQTVKIDLHTPVKQFEALWKKTVDNPLNLGALTEAITKFLSNCLPPSESTREQLSTISKALQFEISTLYPNLRNPAGITAEEDQWACPNGTKNFMQGPIFKGIHNYLWGNSVEGIQPDAEWHDMVEFVYFNGFDGTVSPTDPLNLYEKIQSLYTACECPLEVPTGPRVPPTSGDRKKRSLPQKSVNVPLYEEHSELFSTFQEGGTCDLFELIALLYQSNIEHLANFIRFIMTALNTDYSVHFFGAKVAEASKGVSFRNFRQQESMIAVIHYLDNAIADNEIIKIIEGLTGINFRELHLADNIISFCEYGIWRTPFPVPT